MLFYKKSYSEIFFHLIENFYLIILFEKQNNVSLQKVMVITVIKNTIL